MKNSDSEKRKTEMDDLERLITDIREKADNEPEKALLTADAALKNTRDAGTEIRILVEKGRIYRKLTDYPRAIESLTTAVLMSEEHGDGKLIKMSANSLGILYRQIGDFEKALDVYNRMLSKTDLRNEPEYYAYMLNNLGVVYRHLKERDKALENYTKALDLYELAREDKGYADTLNNIGLIYSELEQPRQGLEYFRRSLEIREKINDRPGIAVSYHNLGLAFYRDGKYDQSEESYTRSLELFREQSNGMGITKTHEALGEVLTDKGDLMSAEDHLVTALHKALEMDNSELVKGIYENLSWLEEHRKDYMKALEYFKKYCECEIKTAEKLRRDMFDRVSIKFEIEKKEIEIQKQKDEKELYTMMNKELNKANTLISKKNRELEEAAKKLRELADYDQLTGLPNRRSAWERLKLESTRFERSGNTFSVIMADLDNFKSFNDKHGHECGDRLLEFVSGIFLKNIRKQDMAARWGGEEFLLILPETSKVGCEELAGKICRAVEESEFVYSGKSSRITVTMGYAVYDGKLDIERIIDVADKAMYRGKRAGKNRVSSL